MSTINYEFQYRKNEMKALLLLCIKKVQFNFNRIFKISNSFNFKYCLKKHGNNFDDDAFLKYSSFEIKTIKS